MFAPLVAKPKIKAAEPQRSAVAAQRPGSPALAQRQLLQRTIGNQAMIRLLAQRAGAASNAPGPIQAKLKVGAVNDPLEHEADRVADQVMRMPAPEVLVAAAPPQVSRKCAECEEQEKLQRKSAGLAEAPGSEAPAIVHEVLRSPGQPLDAATRDYFEPRFGCDFSDVRVHTDARAADSARAVQARAYTVGSDVVFENARFAPFTSEGRSLLAHELTHVVQQSSGALAIQRAPDPESDREAALKEAEAVIAELDATLASANEEDKPAYIPMALPEEKCPRHTVLSWEEDTCCSNQGFPDPLAKNKKAGADCCNTFPEFVDNQAVSLGFDGAASCSKRSLLGHRARVTSGKGATVEVLCTDTRPNQEPFIELGFNAARKAYGSIHVLDEKGTVCVGDKKEVTTCSLNTNCTATTSPKEAQCLPRSCSKRKTGVINVATVPEKIDAA